MSNKYKILMICYDPNTEPFYDIMDGEFDTITAAQKEMYEAAMEEAMSMNESWLSDGSIEKIHEVHINSDISVSVLVCYKGCENTSRLIDYIIIPKQIINC